MVIPIVTAIMIVAGTMIVIVIAIVKVIYK